MRTKSFIVLVFTLFGSVHLFGQESRKEICVDFRVGKSTLDTAYVNNAERLAEIVSFLGSVKNDGALDLVEVSFCGSAAPEGSAGINRRLAEERRAAVENYVRRCISLPDSIVTRCDATIAWERLACLAEQSDMPHKEEAVEVLRNVPEYTYNDKGVLIDSKKKHLMELQYGRTWFYMLEHFFPQVRNASVVFVTVRQKPVIKSDTVELQTVPAIDTAAVIQETDTLVPQAIVPEQEERKPFYMAVKTNMLYDVLAVPNIGVEFYLGKGWTLGGNWMYGWWDKGSKHRYWRVYGGDIAVRKWLGKRAAGKPLTGHHLGVYGQVFTYDFEWGGTGYMGGEPGGTLWDKGNYAVGVEYGYSLPVARRLNIDFTIGVGYWGGKYYTYSPLDGHDVWESTKNRHWFGPTKAEISLVWLLGRGNSNNRKGGMK